MSNIAENLVKLSTDKTDIQSALINKGITNAMEHGFDDFAQDITSIQNSYTLSDEGKVVNNGILINQTTKNITENGTIDTTTNNIVQVNVPTGASESDVQNLVVASKPYYESRAGSTSTTTVTSEIYAYNKSSYYYPLYMLKGLTFTINRKYSVSGTYSGTTTADCIVVLKNGNTTIATYDLGRFTKTKDASSLNTTVTSTFNVSNFQEYFSSYPNGLLYIQNTIIKSPSGHSFTSVVTLSSTTIST